MNVRLAQIDLRSDLAGWMLIPAVFALAAVLIAVPASLLHTFQSPRFIGYLGAPPSDLRVDLAYSADLEQRQLALLAELDADDRIVDVRSYANAIYEIEGAEGWEVFRAEVGDYSGDTVEFTSGTAPATGQIALSSLNAQHLEVSVGDTVALRTDDRSSVVVVSGIYQDVTAGGRTAKLAGRVPDDVVGFVTYATTADGVDVDAIASDYAEVDPGAKVLALEAYTQQTLSYVVNAFSAAAWIALVLGVFVASLITYLYLTLRLARERRRHGVLAALGFSGAELAAQLRLKATLMIAVGALAGFTFAATAGENIVGAALALTGFGITELDFFPTHLIEHALYPALLIGSGVAATCVVAHRLHANDTSGWLHS